MGGREECETVMARIRIYPKMQQKYSFAIVHRLLSRNFVLVLTAMTRRHFYMQESRISLSLFIFIFPYRNCHATINKKTCTNHRTGTHVFVGPHAPTVFLVDISDRN